MKGGTEEVALSEEGIVQMTRFSGVKGRIDRMCIWRRRTESKREHGGDFVYL